jgi:hypothetical protein
VTLLTAVCSCIALCVNWYSLHCRFRPSCQGHEALLLLQFPYCSYFKLKALQALDTIKLCNDTPRTVKIFTDSKITLLSLKNGKNRKHLIEQIRRKTTDLEKENWYIEFTWIKAHSEISGNELADKLVKEATENSEICYNKITRSEIERQE